MFFLVGTRFFYMRNNSIRNIISAASTYSSLFFFSWFVLKQSKNLIRTFIKIPSQYNSSIVLNNRCIVLKIESQPECSYKLKF